MEHRPSTTIVSAKGDPMDRKVKLLNKTVKTLRMEIAELQRENYTMKKVRFSVSHLGKMLLFPEIKNM